MGPSGASFSDTNGAYATSAPAFSGLNVRDVAARGARIRFVDSDPEDERTSRTPLVLLHDCLASHATFSATLPFLSRGFRVIAPDLPGFGASEKPDPRAYAYGYDAFAESIVDLAAALGLGRVHVCGHGMGGGVALTLAANFPTLVHRLVLVDALVYECVEQILDRASRAPVLGALVWRQIVGPALFRAHVHANVYAGADRIPAGRIEALFRHFNAPDARHAAHATIVARADRRSLVAHLPRVKAETLVVWGRGDTLTPVDQGRRLARELRGRLEVLECGRCAPEEVPEAFATVITPFLEAALTPPPPRVTPKRRERTPSVRDES